MRYNGPCKRTQHVGTTLPNVAGIVLADVRFKARANNMLRSFVHHVGLCCMMLVYVASSLKPVKLFAQHIPTFLLFSGDRWARWLHSHMKWLYSVIKCIVTFSLTFPSSLLKLSVLVYALGVFLRWQRTNAMHFRVFHHLHSSSAITGGRTWQHCSLAKSFG